MLPEEVEQLFARFVERVNLALVPEPGDSPSGRKVMTVGRFGKMIHTNFGQARVLSFVVFIMGANHGFRIEMLGRESFTLRAWDHSKSTGIGQVMITVEGDLTVSHLELVARMVAIPFQEESSE